MPQAEKSIAKIQSLLISNNEWRWSHKPVVHTKLYQSIRNGAYAFLDYLNAPTDDLSRRENSRNEDTIGEFWCALSNIPFFMVALYFLDVPLFLSATFSLLSHAIPKKGLHKLDLLGVALVGIRVLIGIPLLISNPVLLSIVAAVGAVAIGTNLLDTHLNRNHHDKIGPCWMHVAWHIAGAAAMFVFNAAVLSASLGLVGLSVSMPHLAIAFVIGTGIVVGVMAIISKLYKEKLIEKPEAAEQDVSNDTPTRPDTRLCTWRPSMFAPSPCSEQTHHETVSDESAAWAPPANASVDAWFPK